ncbi:MAG: hypothetical protein ACI3ZL_07145 [Candidatus Cryptobacteroides sp.]
MKTIKHCIDGKTYVCPSATILDIRPEGVLCESGSGTMSINDFVRDEGSEDFLNF